MVLWRPTRPSWTNTQRRCPLHYRPLECKCRKSRATWSNRQIWPWSREQSRSKADGVLPRECTGYSKHSLPSAQEKILHMDLTRWSVLIDYQIDCILCSQRWRSSIQSAKARPGADCFSDHELLIFKFRLIAKLKRVGKTTRPFRCDLNQIPYNYTVKVTNRFQGIRSDRQSAWRTMDEGSWHSTGGSDQDHPQEKVMQKGKMVVWWGLTNSFTNSLTNREKKRS